MDKEILFLSDPGQELRRVNKRRGRHPWFSLGGDFDHALVEPDDHILKDPFDFSEDPGSGPDADFFHSPERRNYGDAVEIHDGADGFFVRPGNRLTIEGILMVNHKNSGYEEYLIESRSETQVVMDADVLGIPNDLYFKVESADGEIWLSSGDGRSVLIYEKKAAARVRLYGGVFFWAMLPDDTVLEMTFRAFSPVYDTFRSYMFSPRKERITIGRRDASDIRCVCRCIDEKGRRTGDLISRNAGVIRRFPNRVILENTSGHGIYVNHHPVHGLYPLQEGDVITFWNCRMVWHEDRLEIRNSEDIRVSL